MRVLLDENIDRRLKRFFDDDFEVITVSEQRWQGTKNGKLLQRAAQEFDVFVTMDRNLQHQQNLDGVALAVVVIYAFSNALPVVTTLMPQVNEAIRIAPQGSVTHVKQAQD